MITSTANHQVKQMIQFNKKGKHRNAHDIFVVEGVKMFSEAPRERIVKAYFSESYVEKQLQGKLLEDISCEVVEDSIFKNMCDTQTPQGVLCLVRQYHYSLKELLQKENPLLLVLENIQDPGNLGTMIRTAEGAGVDGVILSPDCVDIYNPKTIRSTMGSIYRVPFFLADDLQGILKELRQEGIHTFAACLKESKSYEKGDYTKGTAFLLGNESNGLSLELAAGADTRIRIPMEGKLESLNVSIASAILLYEACRQRR